MWAIKAKNGNKFAAVTSCDEWVLPVCRYRAEAARIKKTFLYGSGKDFEVVKVKLVEVRDAE